MGFIQELIETQFTSTKAHSKIHHILCLCLFPQVTKELLLRRWHFIELALAAKNLCSYAQGNLLPWLRDILSPSKNPCFAYLQIVEI